MQGVNKVILLGRLGQDPELRVTPNGQQVCTLRLATNESWTKDGNKEERTEWHRVILWGRQAEIAGKYLKKGRGCYIEGKLQTRSWDDQQGQKRYMTEIVASSIQFIDSAASRGGNDTAPDTPDVGHDQGGGGNYGGYQAPAAAGFDAPAGRGQTSGTSSGFRGSDMDDDVPF